MKVVLPDAHRHLPVAVYRLPCFFRDAGATICHITFNRIHAYNAN